MKGVIVNCLEELVVAKSGKEGWQQCLEKAGLKKGAIFLAFSDIDDPVAMQLIATVGQYLRLSPLELAEKFGEYWIDHYTKNMYPKAYYEHANLKEFLLDLNAIHLEVTKKVPNARPPRFEFEWKTEQTLVMHYSSYRHLIDFVVGLIKAVAKHYHERVEIKKLGTDMVRVKFLEW